MSNDLKNVVIDLFAAFDKLDIESVIDRLSDDIEQVDELTQKWSRSKAKVAEAYNGFAGMVSDIKSELSDFNVIASSDMSIVTCTLHQSYTYEGNPVSIVAPTTVVFRQDGGAWKIVLIHSIPFA
jgi:ketosteroid isomerase-like protein